MVCLPRTTSASANYFRYKSRHVSAKESIFSPMHPIHFSDLACQSWWVFYASDRQGQSARICERMREDVGGSFNTRSVLSDAILLRISTAVGSSVARSLQDNIRNMIPIRLALDILVCEIGHMSICLWALQSKRRDAGLNYTDYLQVYCMST